MPTKRLTMRRIHRLMTLRFGAGATTRAISRELGISHSTVREYLARIAAAGITWPLPAELTDRELEQRLFVNGGVRVGARHHVEPDWAAVARELKRPGVNLMILWENIGRFILMATPTAVMLRPYLCCAPRSDFRTYRSAAFS